MSVYVANESGAAVDEPALSALSRFVLDQMGVDPLAELSVLLVDVAAMTALHEQWMGEQGPTDVLAFPMDELDAALPGGAEDLDTTVLLGDVVLCPAVAATQARTAGHSTEAELHLLATHGVLHLLGFDHEETDEAAVMYGRQGELLAAWASANAAREPQAADPAG